MPLKDIDAMATLASFARKEDINVKELATALNITEQALGGMIGTASRHPGVYMELRKAGYTEAQVAPWFRRPQQTHTQEPTDGGESPEVSDSAETLTVNPAAEDSDKISATEIKEVSLKPLHSGAEVSPPVTTVNKIAGQVVSVRRSGNLPDGIPKPKGQPLQLKPVKQLREKQPAKTQEEKGGLYDGTFSGATSLPDGTIQLADGRWMGMRVLNDQVILEEVAAASGSKSNVGAKISEITTANLDVLMQSIARKTALNPTVYMSFAYLQNKVDPATGEAFFDPRKDMGDFLNFCVKFTMKHGYGVEPGMIVTNSGMYQQSRGGQQAMLPMGRNFEPV